MRTFINHFETYKNHDITIRLLTEDDGTIFDYRLETYGEIHNSLEHAHNAIDTKITMKKLWRAA